MAVDNAASAYFARLPVDGYPAQSHLDAANLAIHRVATERLFSREWVSVWAANSHLDDSEIQRVKSFFREFPQPTMPSPPFVAEPISARVALAAVVGALAGMCVFGPIGRFLLGNETFGLLLGATVGSGIVAYATHQAAKSSWFKATLTLALGSAAVFEVWQVAHDLGPPMVKLVWRGLREKKSALKRICILVALLLVLFLAKRRVSFDVDAYRKSVKLAIDHWLRVASGVLAGGVAQLAAQTECRRPLIPAALADTLQRFLEATEAEFSVLKKELSTKLNNEGVTFGDYRLGQQSTWSETLEEYFSTYGHIEYGDPVIIESRPVLIDGTIEQKGLVRKYRARNEQ